jgi:hypothetical protein
LQKWLAIGAGSEGDTGMQTAQHKGGQHSGPSHSKGQNNQQGHKAQAFYTENPPMNRGNQGNGKGRGGFNRNPNNKGFNKGNSNGNVNGYNGNQGNGNKKGGNRYNNGNKQGFKPSTPVLIIVLPTVPSVSLAPFTAPSDNYCRNLSSPVQIMLLTTP